jgi:parallel beta-helix repeat protein
VIGTDNITLDLNGHAIGGDGVPAGACFDEGICDLGISNDAGHAGVTITGGAVRGFDIGISVLGGSGNRVQRVALATNSTFGVIAGDSTVIRIDHNLSVDEGISGIVMFDSSNSRVEDNSVTGAHGYGIAAFGSSHNRLERNLLAGNDHGILLDSSDNKRCTGIGSPTPADRRSTSAIRARTASGRTFSATTETA